MTEREKIITSMECCKDVHQSGRWASGCISCGYADKHRPDCFLRLADDAVELLKEQPDIVRCKDCKWYDERISMCDNCGLPREQTFFCADGRRRDEND